MQVSFRWSSACSAMALSLPPLQQKRMGSGIGKKCSTSIRPCRDRAQHPAPLQERSLVLAAEPVFHANTHVTSDHGKADRILLLLVEKVSSTGGNRDAYAPVISSLHNTSRG